MSLKISFPKNPAKDADTAVVFVYEGGGPDPQREALDRESGGLIARALKTHRKFKGRKGETLALILPEKTGFTQALCLGLGKADKLDVLGAEEAGGKLFTALERAGASKAALLAGKTEKITPEILAHLALGAHLRSYKFARYKKPKNDHVPFARLEIISDSARKTGAAYEILAKTAEGVFFARDLVNAPPDAKQPEEFTRILKDRLGRLGIKIEIMDEKKMLKLGMGGILAVGQGSAHPPRIVLMHWRGGKVADAPVALVGKGITFDTGGISIKPADNMHEMKMDMGGAAAVCGAMMALALRGAKANVTGIVGLAENMPSGAAYRPGDIITSHAGKTVEIMNTDAEGRLVLADLLSYIQEKHKPGVIVDVATLTGAMMVALGFEYCGTFANDDGLWNQLNRAGAETGEKLWRMPLDEHWKKEMESETADLQNLAKSGRWGGACTAAGFLEHFIEGKTPWAHMDIAGTAWRKYDKPTVPKFGTGFGVRVLERWIAENHEG